MKVEMFSVFDKRSKVYSPPSFGHNAGHACRQFKMVFANPECIQRKFPDDYQVWFIGRFDDRTGFVEPLPNPELVCEMVSLFPEEGVQNGVETR